MQAKLFRHVINIEGVKKNIVKFEYENWYTTVSDGTELCFQKRRLVDFSNEFTGDTDHDGISSKYLGRGAVYITAAVMLFY